MMLRDLAKIVDQHENQGITELDIENTAAALRQHQFIWREKRNHSRHYDLLVKFQDYYEDLFGAFGDTFFIDHHFGYCGILPRSTTPSLKLRDTIFLLILCKLHDGECRKACTENGRSTPSEEILLDEYVELTGKPKPTKTETKESLDRLVKQGVIELGDFNPDTELRRITILPSIMRVVNSRFLDELEQFSQNADDITTETQHSDDTGSVKKALENTELKITTTEVSSDE
jgi:hypothetical protein